jgi:PTS system galactitol-specific IIB component
MLKLTVACGGGIVTTTLVTDQLKEILRKERIEHAVTPAKITQIANIQDADLIVVTGKTSVKNVNNIPIMIGISLVTGVGEAKFVKEFMQKVNEIKEAKKNGKS